MKLVTRPRRFSSTLLLIPLALSLSQCGQKEEAAPQTGATPAAPAPAVPGVSSKGETATVAPSAPAAPSTPAAPAVKAPSLVDHAAKLGFAAKLPLSTEVYVSSVQLKKHLDGLKQSNWWKDLSALAADKTPAPAAGDNAQELLKQMWGDDVFVAGAAGFAESAEMLREFNRVYNEVNFKILMSGQTANMAGNEGGMVNPLAFIQPLLSDEANLERVGQIVARFELPPLILGVKTDKSKELLAEMFSEKSMKNKPPQIEVSDFKSPDGQDFKVITIDMAKVITEEKQKEFVANAPKALPEPALKALEKAITDVRKKKFVFGFGSVDGHLIVSTGKNLDHVKFAPDAASSLLARPELGHLLPYAEKNLCALTYASAATLNAIHDDQPLIPMLRGVVGALKENEMFKAMGDILDKKVTELSPLESNVYNRQFTSIAGAGWWEGGALQGEFFGGTQARFMTGGKPLTFAPLVDQPGVVFGIAYHRNPEYEKAVRLWIEKFVSIAYTAAQELVKAGIAGQDGGMQFAMFEGLLLPTLLKVYEANKAIDEKGLGSQFAMILDVNGKMPSLPNVPIESAEKMKFPRATMIGDVASRAEIAAGWKSINETVTGVAAMVASMSGGTKEGAAPPAIPSPESAEANGMTTWFYKNEFLNGDLYPAAAINDKLLVLSTSKPAAEAFAAGLAKPSDTKIEGCVWRFDASALATFVSDTATLNPTQTPEQIKELKQNLKWVQPFHALEGHIFEEKGQPRVSLKWEISDLVSFD